MPSPNPAGRGGKLAAGKAPGSDGVIAHGGFLLDAERHADLVGSNRWVKYDNLSSNCAAVASALHVWLTLAGSVKWQAQENAAGGKDAATCAELVHDGLLAARMTKPWRNVVKRQAMKKFRGFALHAKGITRDGQGRVVFSELGHRPQWTVYRWLKPIETEPWIGIEQQTRMGARYPIARSDLFYSAEDALTDSPDGIGLFRHIVEAERIFARYRQLQGIAFDTDINGVPLGRAPLSAIYDAAKKRGDSDADAAAAVRSATLVIQDFIENRVVKSNRSLLLDSIPVFSVDTDGSQRPSSIYQWSVDTIKSLIGSIPELRAALGDLNREILRVMSAEWMAMGDSEGARSVHGDKTQMFCAVINALLDDLADDATRDLSWWLTAMNGYDPNTCAPTLVHEPVRMKSALDAAQMLKVLSEAALHPDDEAIAILRSREDLPPPPDEAGELMLRAMGGAADVEEDDEAHEIEDEGEDVE